MFFFLYPNRIGSTVEHFVMSKPLNPLSLVTVHTGQQDQTSEMNAQWDVGYGNPSNDELAHHESENAAAQVNLSPKPFIKTPGRKKMKLEVIDGPMPRIKTELNISSESLNITLPKPKRGRPSAAIARPTFLLPITKKEPTKDDTMRESEPHQPKQPRKRRTMNTTIAGNLKKKQKLNDTTLAIVKQFKCNLCEYSTNINRALSKHMRLHIQERLHECNVCYIRFTARGNLNAHMKKHSDVFKYQCSNCRLGFMLKKPWKLHESCCTARNYVCYLCDKKFYQRKSDLSRHLRIWHTGVKPFGCSECPQKYTLKHELQRHERYHHGKEI